MKKKLLKDPIVEEIRMFRHEHELRFGQNLDAILSDIQRHQVGTSHKIVRLPAKRIAISDRLQRTSVN